MTDKTEKIVTDAAKSKTKDKKFDIAGSGDRILIKPVATALLQKLYGRLEIPEVPSDVHPETGRAIENPEDPTYKQALRDLEEERSQIAVDAFIMFGIELVDGLPEDNSWIKKLQFMDIEINETDSTELEFAYKKFIIADASLIMKVGNISGASSAQVSAAREEFPD